MEGQLRLRALQAFTSATRLVNAACALDGLELFGPRPEFERYRERLRLLSDARKVRARDVLDVVLPAALDAFTVLKLAELWYERAPALPAEDRAMSAHLMDLYRLEVRRQACVCIDVVDATLQTPNLFSEDSAYPGITRASLNDFRGTLQNEIQKIDANQATIAVIGTVKSGKSTAINAIVGSEAVPSRDQPMTTFPTRVIHTAGVTEAELDFPLAPAFNNLISVIREELKRRTDSDPQDLAALIAKAPQKGELDKLIAQVSSGDSLVIARSAQGRASMDLLISINDLTRLAKVLELSMDHLTPRRLGFEDTPSIAIQFQYLVSGESRFSGTLALIDTPGPDEAGQSERLARIVQEQLEDASAIILVIDYAHLGNEATAGMIESLLKGVPAQASSRVFVFVNKYDSRGAEGDEGDPATLDAMEEDRRARLRGSVAQRMSERFGVEPEKFSEQIFPTSAKDALLANRARRALSDIADSSDPEAWEGLPVQLAWVRDFAARAFGTDWREEPALLADAKAVRRRANTIWAGSLYAEPLERVIATSARNAGKILAEACLDKLITKGTPLFEMFGVRDGAFKTETEKLLRHMRENEADREALENAHRANEKYMESMFASVQTTTKSYVDAVLKLVDAAVAEYVATGSPDQAVASAMARAEQAEAERSNMVSAVFRRVKELGRSIGSFVASTVGDLLGAGEQEQHAELEARIKESFEGAPEFPPVFDEKSHMSRIRMPDEAAAEALATAIFGHIELVYDDQLGRMESDVQATFEQFTVRVQENVVETFDPLWKRFRDRVKGLLDVPLSPPPYSVDHTIPLAQDELSRAIDSERETTTERRERPGQVVQRKAGVFFSWFGADTEHWGYKIVARTSTVYYLNIDDINGQLRQRHGRIVERVESSLLQSKRDLSLRLDAYNLGLQSKIAATNEYVLQETKARTQDAAAYAKLRARISSLASQARNLVQDSASLHAALAQIESS
jgi:signal recognition particle receptor subunit beta